MSLQFILGTAQADHHQAVIDTARQCLHQDAQAQVFYLVPNHVKFEAEVSLLQGLREGPVSAQTRVQTLSFSRLAWYFVKNDPVYQQPRLDRASNTMLVARLLQAHQAELRVYAGETSRPGFIAQLADQLSELTTGRVTAAALAAVAATLPAGDRHRQKLADLVVMLTAYEDAIGPYVTEPSLLTALGAKLQTLDLSHTTFILNHFNDLSATELALVTALMTHAKQVVVALTLDRPAVDGVPTPPALFLPAARVYHRLYKVAKDAKLAILRDRYAQPRTLSPAMAAVEAFWRADTALSDETLAPVAAGVTLAKASDTYTELRHVAQAINQAVHHGARYRDFLIVARHLDPYKDLIAPIFAALQVPVFVDVEHPMANHPLMALLDSLLAIQAHHYQYQDVMRLLKTELLVPETMTLAEFREALDVTDNHLLRTGLTGSQWLKGTPWQYFRRRADDEASDRDPAKTRQINQIRQYVAATLPPLFDALTHAETGQAAATVLYQWLTQNGVTKRLGAWRQAAIDVGDLAQASAGEQAWTTFVGLLDDFVAVLGEAPFDLAQFTALLAAGIAGATYTQIPSTLDQVTVSETGLSRLAKFKHVFVIGATSLVMPDTPSDTAVLTAADRKLIGPQLPDGAFLAQAGVDTTLGEPFLNYLAMLAADTSLTMSYPVYAERENQPSAYLTQLAVRLQRPIEAWQSVQLTTPLEAVAGTARSLLTDFVAVARQAQDQHVALGPTWQGVLRVLQQDPKRGHLATRLAGSLDYQNAVGQLSPDLAQKLYGAHLNVSISKLETYYRNPFEYFLTYGLRLRKRPEFELTPADTGSLYHSVMDQYLRDLAAQDRTLAEVAPAEIGPAVTSLIDAAVQNPGYEILTANAQMATVRQRVVRMLTDVLVNIHGQQARSAFRPRATELLFGQFNQENGLAPLILPVGRDHSITVRGKIDRLDTVALNDAEYFLIVDYKSSAHDFDPLAAYYGTSLQLLTYIDAVQNNARASQQQLRPAGAVYFKFTEPKLKYAPGQDTQAEAFKQYQMKGLLVMPEASDEALALAAALDRTLATAGKSAIVPLAVTKAGALAKTNKNRLTPAELHLYLLHNRRRITAAAAAILQGTIDLAPIQFNQESTVITNSDYQAIMTFDPATGYDRYHHVPHLDRETLLDHLKAEQDDLDEEETDDELHD
ncbi:PD-(D/E)XK nuclease family protein [Lacticaseibacillus daqingensis]|uniref:PD-(D/E)XK nuclease family protein n=1 Tax=Lacticaseibacillus daqingensis TaxID=2486014 RepID=UPI000F775F6D|nr:PD-(D/E)XK nuclease family protein [Lacticaseibacillus daqingensis]